jgi:hypothetical protein
VDEREKALAAAKAQHAAAEADLSFLVGKASADEKTSQAAVRYLQRLTPVQAGQLTSDLSAGLQEQARTRWEWTRPAKGPVADRLRKALDRPLTIEANDQPLSRILKSIRDDNPEVYIQLPRALNLEGKVTVRLENIPLGAALQWLEDVLPGFRVVVRDYGLLLAEKEALPPGALLLDEFWKGDRPKAAEPGAKPAP